jgi:hypothetical protein
MKAVGNEEPIHFNRVGDADRIGFDRTQVAEGLPSLRLAAGRLMELAHYAKRSRLDRANLWRASSATLRCCALWHMAIWEKAQRCLMHPGRDAIGFATDDLRQHADQLSGSLVTI